MKLKAAREKLGLTQNELAELVGVSQVAVSRVENGEMKMPPNWKPILIEFGRRKMTTKNPSKIDSETIVAAVAAMRHQDRYLLYRLLRHPNATAETLGRIPGGRAYTPNEQEHLGMNPRPPEREKTKSELRREEILAERLAIRNAALEDLYEIQKQRQRAERTQGPELLNGERPQTPEQTAETERARLREQKAAEAYQAAAEACTLWAVNDAMGIPRPRRRDRYESDFVINGR